MPYYLGDPERDLNLENYLHATKKGVGFRALGLAVQGPGVQT